MPILELLLLLSFSLPLLDATPLPPLKLHGGHSFPNPLMMDIKSQILDHATKVLRRKGYGIVATALATKKPDLLKLNDVTVFATPDALLFSEPNGFHYDFLSHVVPKRYHLAELKKMKLVKTVREKLVEVGIDNGFLEIYYNRWIVVVSVGKGFYDSEEFGSQSPSPGIGVYGEEDYNVGGSEMFVSEKMVESAPSKQMNGVSRLLSEKSIAEIERRLRSGALNSENGRIVQFDVADDLFFYT